MALHIIEEATRDGRLRAGRHDRRGDQRQHGDLLRGGRARVRASGHDLHARLDEPGAARSDRQLRRARSSASAAKRAGSSAASAGGGNAPAARPARLPAVAVLERSESGRARGDDRAGDPRAAGGRGRVAWTPSSPASGTGGTVMGVGRALRRHDSRDPGAPDRAGGVADAVDRATSAASTASRASPTSSFRRSSTWRSWTTSSPSTTATRS